MIRVLVVDDHQLIREGLCRSFHREPDFEVVAEASSIAAAETALARHTLDLAVIDLHLPDGDGLTLVRQARARSANLGIVVFTMKQGDRHLFDALSAGASAFVNKGSATDEVVATCRHAAGAPGTFIAADLAGAMRRRMNPDRVRLSVREEDILLLLKEGLSTAEIGRRLFISASTAKSHIAKIYEKLGVSNRAQALMEALRLELIRHDVA